MRLNYKVNKLLLINMLYIIITDVNDLNHIGICKCFNREEIKVMAIAVTFTDYALMNRLDQFFKDYFGKRFCATYLRICDD